MTVHIWSLVTLDFDDLLKILVWVHSRILNWIRPSTSGSYKVVLNAVHSPFLFFLSLFAKKLQTTKMVDFHTKKSDNILEGKRHEKERESWKEWETEGNKSNAISIFVLSPSVVLCVRTSYISVLKARGKGEREKSSNKNALTFVGWLSTHVLNRKKNS